jgi:glutamate dehydrogenase
MRLARAFADLFVARFDPRLSRGRRRPSPGSTTASDRAAARGGQGLRRGPHPARLLERPDRDGAHQRLSDGLARASSRTICRSRSRAKSCANCRCRSRMFEVFVFSTRMEGVHLRMGNVARGGIRWSDRREDFRTEILGLMKAQQVKNAVIVPVGAKGGFVVKRCPPRRPRRARQQAEASPATRLHPRLLDSPTTSSTAGSCRRPTSCATTATIPISWSPPTRAPRLLRHRQRHLRSNTASGSATPSPPAARPATTTRRWASPRAAPGNASSAISARSASTSSATPSPWSASATCRATCSATACCVAPHPAVAAFNHQHIFIDPEPDAARSFAERERLFKLPRSSWEDYDEAR